MKKTVKDIDIKNKTVILRCDFNVPQSNDEILDDTKIKEALPTIKYLLENDCKIIILSHLGKVKKEEDKNGNSLKKVAIRLGELLDMNILFPGVTRDVSLESQIKDMLPKRIMLLENTRYEDVDGNLESSCDEELAKYWAGLGEVFVNDAFGTVHRCHASNYGISKYLPSVIGLLMEKEIKALDIVAKNPERPYTVIMGGAKLEDKTELIENIIKKCDYLLLTGGIANTFLKALGFNIGFSIYSESCIPLVKKIMLENKNKILLPLDAVVGNKYDKDYCNYVLINEVTDNDVIYDVGVKTIEKYQKAINISKTIFLNGTVGKYEDVKFQNGTKDLLNVLAKCPAKVIVGGGDAVSSVVKFGYQDKYAFLSTGGGASLEYLIDQNLKCLENIEEE